MASNELHRGLLRSLAVVGHAAVPRFRAMYMYIIPPTLDYDNVFAKVSIVRSARALTVWVYFFSLADLA